MHALASVMGDRERHMRNQANSSLCAPLISRTHESGRTHMGEAVCVTSRNSRLLQEFIAEQERKLQPCPSRRLAFLADFGPCVSCNGNTETIDS